MRTHLSGSSGLDGMPLTFDAFRERSVLGFVFLDKWVRLSALHMIASWLELHTQTPGPERLGTIAGLSVGLLKPWSKSSLALYSYIVTLGIREQRKASFSPYPHRSEFWVTLIFLRDDRTRLIYVWLEHLVDCLLLAVGQLCLSRVFVFWVPWGSSVQSPRGCLVFHPGVAVMLPDLFRVSMIIDFTL